MATEAFSTSSGSLPMGPEGRTTTYHCQPSYRTLKRRQLPDGHPTRADKHASHASNEQ